MAKEAQPGVTREMLGAYLCRPTVRRHLVWKVRRKVPKSEVDELVDGIRLEA